MYEKPLSKYFAIYLILINIALLNTSLDKKLGFPQNHIVWFIGFLII